MWLSDFQSLYACGMSDSDAGNTWKGWNEGQFQAHFIYTGVAESIFMIFPDGTTMLLDCGDHNAIGRGKLAVPVLPNGNRHAGEWIARYVERVNPHGRDVDYMMLSHYHSDHGGSETFYADQTTYGGKPYIISGFSQAAQTLNFGKCFDRCWPDYSDPIPLLDDEEKLLTHMSRFYDYMQAERGMAMEKFRVGAWNQVKLLHSPEDYPAWSVFNICGNGRIASADGHVTNLYSDYIENSNPTTLNENGMSLGMVISYGPFRLFTAGDFSDSWNLADGSTYEIENSLADVCPQVDVAKINHHGHYSMPQKLIAALRAKVYVSCVWDQLHDVAPVMERLADRSIYPGDRVICPGIFPRERVDEDAGKAFLRDIQAAAFTGGHIVLNVEKGGRRYSITYLSADDESMTQKSVLRFTTASKPEFVSGIDNVRAGSRVNAANKKVFNIEGMEIPADKAKGIVITGGKKKLVM